MSVKTGSADLDGGTAMSDGRVIAPPPFREIFETHAPYVWRTLFRLGVRAADAEDMCQEVFLVVHRRLAEFDGTSAVRTWVYGITMRVASQYRRRAYRKREELSDELPEAAIPAPQEGAVDGNQLLHRLEAALDRLDEDKRAVFVLYELEELTMNEVAQVVSCPLQTAYSRLYAARDIVQQAFRVIAKERRS